MTGSYRNKAGVERTLKALRTRERLLETDEAIIALIRSTAAALDTVDPAAWPAQYASLARAHLAALCTLEGVRDDDATLDVDTLLATLRDGEDTEP